MNQQIEMIGALYRLAAFCLAMVFLLSPMPRAIAQEPEYPIVFADATELNQLGIALGSYGKNADKVKPFRNRCYYYGDGGLSLSVSDLYLDTHKARGFSLNSLCMALASGVRFNPETGAPLPTYIVADLEELKRQGKEAEVGVISDILPLDVPDCFKRGLPYSDCDMKYDPISGEKLCEQITLHLKRVGKAVEERLERLVRSGKHNKECNCKANNTQEDERCRLEKHCGEGTSGMLAPEILYWDHAEFPGFGAYTPPPHLSFVDISPSFPRGFGYALFADGGAGPSASPDSVEMALDGKHRATEQQIKAVTTRIQQK